MHIDQGANRNSNAYFDCPDLSYLVCEGWAEACYQSTNNLTKVKFRLVRWGRGWRKPKPAVWGSTSKRAPEFTADQGHQNEDKRLIKRINISLPNGSTSFCQSFLAVYSQCQIQFASRDSHPAQSDPLRLELVSPASRQWTAAATEPWQVEVLRAAGVAQAGTADN